MRLLLGWFWWSVKLAFTLVMLGAVVGCYLIYQALTPAGKDQPRIFKVATGASASDVALLLEDQNYIRSALGFRLLLKGVHASDGFRAGRYRLSPGMTAWDVLETLRKGPLEEAGVMVTVPEGKTLREVAAIVEAATKLPAHGFVLLARSPRTLFPERTWLRAHDSAEGYLFPDTFRIPEGARESTVMDLMLARFEQVVLPELKRANVPVTRLHDILVLASMVEGEAQVASERPRIAAVYLNRLKAGMKLQCDATVQYALGDRKPVLSFADLDLVSPYNTYRYDGLPPGPICNPGLAAIRAALYPAREPSLYYVRNDRRNDGSHVFTRSFAEHERAIRDYSKPR